MAVSKNIKAKVPIDQIFRSADLNEKVDRYILVVPTLEIPKTTDVPKPKFLGKKATKLFVKIINPENVHVGYAIVRWTDVKTVVIPVACTSCKKCYMSQNGYLQCRGGNVQRNNSGCLKWRPQME